MSEPTYTTERGYLSATLNGLKFSREFQDGRMLTLTARDASVGLFSFTATYLYDATGNQMGLLCHELERNKVFWSEDAFLRAVLKAYFDNAEVSFSFSQTDPVDRGSDL